MKALALGCGEMGSVAIEDMVESGVFEEVVCGDIDVEKAEKLAGELEGRKTEVSPKSVDVTDHTKLVETMKGCDVIVNCVGPFYKFGVDTVKAAIEARVNYVDICDDYDVTSKVLDLNSKAKEAGITIISGLGTSPGITNLLAKLGANMLDEVEKIHTAWLISGTDFRGLAALIHGAHSMYGEVPTYQEGRYTQVQALVDGEEELEFPEPFGKVKAFHVGHPEPITLPRYLKDVEYVDDKGVFHPPFIRDLILKMGEIGLFSEKPIKIRDVSLSPVDFAANFLREKCLETDVSREGAIRVEVKGKEEGKPTRYVYSGTGTMGPGTGIPASTGAQMLAEGKIEMKGAFAPEGCIEPEEFASKLLEKGVGELKIKKIVEEEIV